MLTLDPVMTVSSPVPSSNTKPVAVGSTGRPRRRWGRRLGFLFLGSVGAFLFWLVAVWPPPLWYRWFWPRATAFMVLRSQQADSLTRHQQRRRQAVDGRLPRKYDPVPLSRISNSIQTAALVAEDHRFFDHGGIDYQAMREALGYRRNDFRFGDPRDRAELRRVLTRAWDRRQRIRGASTITQQLAKNLYLSPSRNPLRKIKEAVTAYRLEWALSKERLLELYLNVVEFGPEIWGVEAASRAYFNRSADRLTTEQAAALAATLPLPLKANPGFRPGRLRWRQDLILRRMHGEPIRPPADSELVEEPPPLDVDDIPPP